MRGTGKSQWWLATSSQRGDGDRDTSYFDAHGLAFEPSYRASGSWLAQTGRLVKESLSSIQDRPRSDSMTAFDLCIEFEELVYIAASENASSPRQQLRKDGSHGHQSIHLTR